MSQAYAQTARLLAMASPLGDAIVPYRLTGEEGLSRPFRFEVECYAAQPVAAGDLLGQPVSLRIRNAAGTRRISGIVASFAAGGWIARGVRGFRIEVVPEFWRLALRTRSRVFQKLGLKAILDRVLAEGEITRVERRLSGTYPDLPTVTQYDETDLAFVSRLMERAGISYYFTHAEAGSTLVLCDSTSAWFALEPAALALAETAGPVVGLVTSWQERAALVAGSFEVQDRDPTFPAVAMAATEATAISHLSSSRTGRREAPAGTDVDAAGTAHVVPAHLARLRQEEEEGEAQTGSGTSTVPQLMPGAKFTLRQAAAAEDGTAYAVATVRHEARDVLHFNRDAGDLAHYENAFTCVPAARAWRPPRRTPRPQMRGPHTAPVVGPGNTAGDIHTDEYGRVKVQLFWDREGTENDEGAAWVPVVQGLAGPGWGMFALPRLGMEVVVDFLYGDPDRPVVTGCVYGATAKPPFTLPGEKTRTGIRTRSHPDGDATTFNELRFEDKKDSEQVFLQAQKDFSRLVKNDDALEVQRDRVVTVTRHLTGKVTEGDVAFTVEKGARTTEIKQGDDSLTLGQGNAAVKLDRGNLSVTLGAGNGVVKADAGKLTLEAAQSITLKVGGSSIEMTPTAITLKAGTSEVALSPSGVAVKGVQVGLTAEVKADLKGALTTVEASGILTLKGGLTKIN